MVLYGADEEAYPVMDTGSKRSASDMLPKPYQTVRRSAAHAVFCYLREAISIRGFGLTPGNDEIVETYNEHPTIGQTVDQDMTALRKITRAPSGIVAGFALLRETDRAADSFIARVLSGDSLSKESPELALRNRLIAESTCRSSRLPPATFLAMVLKAWNARRSGTGSLVRIQFREGEAFPRLDAEHRRKKSG